MKSAVFLLIMELYFNLTGSCCVQKLSLCLWACGCECFCSGQWNMSTCTLAVFEVEHLRDLLPWTSTGFRDRQRESGKEEKREQCWRGGGECLITSVSKNARRRGNVGVGALKMCVQQVSPTVEPTSPVGGCESEGTGWHKHTHKQRQTDRHYAFLVWLLLLCSQETLLHLTRVY